MSDDVKSSLGSSIEDINLGGLNLDIEQLDDAEYQIPVVENPPTLESILNDLEDNLSGTANDDNDSLIWSQGVHSNSVLCLEGGSETLSLDSQKSKSSEKKPPTPTTLLRHILLTGISSQIVSAAERAYTGTPTCITAYRLIAIGTSHGYILIFDAGQAMRWCLETPDDEQGSVSSLCFNNDSSRLLAGFARGHIFMFDLTNGKLIRTLTDVHPPATAVLSVKFTDFQNIALCSDSGGSVFELNFKRTLGVRGCDSKCLFSGSRGEVCVVEPLLLKKFAPHPLQGIILVAMATLSKVILISIRPKMRVILVKPLPPNSSVLPLLMWLFITSQPPVPGKVVNPSLVYAKENDVNFLQVSLDGDGKLLVTPLHKISVQFSILSLHWLNPSMLVLTDVNECVHLVDYHTHEDLENLDLSNIELVYESSHFKGIFTGGNVSKAMALAGEKACYNTIVSCGNQIFVLGAKSLYLMNIRPWAERLDHLVEQKQYLAALSLGLSFYEDPKAVIGLKGTRESKLQLTRAKVIELIEQFIDDMDLTVDNISTCVQYAISVNYMDVIFNKLWEIVHLDSHAKFIYSEALEPFILNSQITYIPPAILQQFVNCYEQWGKFQALEACIIRLDVCSLDIHQVFQICWANGLYDALIYIYNKALRDYITPVHELVPFLQRAMAKGKKLTPKQTELGNKLLVYISFCLAGKGYPLGHIPKNSVQSVKYETFKCLTSVHSRNADDNELSYPYLRTFLHFDTREFLNVISLAFSEPEFTSELGLRQRQRLIDLLLNIVVDSPGYSEREIGAFFTFLARQISKPWAGLQIDDNLFKRIFDYLTAPNSNDKEERQHALVDLLRSGTLRDYSKEQVLELACKAKLVCEYIYEKSGEWDKVLGCYLEDPTRTPHVFAFIRNILLVHHTLPDYDKLGEMIYNKLFDLLELDVAETCCLISDYFMDKFESIYESLAGNEKLQLSLLSELVYCKPYASSSESEQATANKYFEKYVELLCEKNPKSVVDELVKYPELSDRREIILIVRRFQHHEAEAYLLERGKKFKEAFRVLAKKLKTALISGEEGEIDRVVTELIGIAQRSHVCYNEPQRRELWLALLDILFTSPNSLTDKEKNEIITKILVGTVDDANPTKILEHILSNRNDFKINFGEIRDLVTGAFESSWFEEQAVKITQKLASQDLYSQLVSRLDKATKGIKFQSTTCVSCEKPLKSSSVVYHCGHVTHRDCFSPYQCPACRNFVLEEAETCIAPVIRNDGSQNTNFVQSCELSLQLSAPPAPDLERLL